MTQRYVIVTEKGRYNEVQFQVMHHEKEVISRVIEIQTRSALDEAEEIKRIFKFDEFGNVTHYHLVLEGFKLQLKAVK